MRGRPRGFGEVEKALDLEGGDGVKLLHLNPRNGALGPNFLDEDRKPSLHRQELDELALQYRLFWPLRQHWGICLLGIQKAKFQACHGPSSLFISGVVVFVIVIVSVEEYEQDSSEALAPST